MDNLFTLEGLASLNGIRLLREYTGPIKVDYNAQLALKTRAMKIAPIATKLLITPAVREIMEDMKKLEISESTMFKIAHVGCSVSAPMTGTMLLTNIPEGADESKIQATCTTPLPKPLMTVRDGTQLTTEVSSARSQGDDDWERILGDDQLGYSGITFMIASLFRLITKEPEAYLRSLPRIKITYQAFYGGSSSAVSFFNPSVEALSMISQGFRTFRHVVAGIIYRVSNAEKTLLPGSKGYQVLQFLMFPHLQYTGMRAYPMIQQIMAKCTLLTRAETLDWLTTEDTKDAIRMVSHIATTYDVPSGKNQRDCLWKYARHLNEGYFLDLQSKRNKELLANLAALHKQLGLDSSNTSASTDNIAILRNCSVLKENAKRFADTFIQCYRSISAESGKLGSNAKRLSERRAAMHASTSISNQDKEPMET
ncbi:hypothetical protein BT93_F2625 [Corymbia citriodora subsp. variegata]|nr:hypothetical protein BT93_F2625 [Corymbia citriodora subsp. variegata]